MFSTFTILLVGQLLIQILQLLHVSKLIESLWKANSIFGAVLLLISIPGINQGPIPLIYFLFLIIFPVNLFSFLVPFFFLFSNFLIDTGLNYNHEDLWGSNANYNQLVQYDYVNEDNIADDEIPAGQKMMAMEQKSQELLQPRSIMVKDSQE